MRTKSLANFFLASLGLGLTLTPSVLAQTLSPDLAKAAQDACVGLAQSKGFALTEVVSVEPKAGTADEATVVLSLDRAGEPYKLTCGYTVAGGVTTSADEASNQAASNPVMQTVSNLVTQVTSNFKAQPESNPAPEPAPSLAQATTSEPAANPVPQPAANPTAESATQPAPSPAQAVVNPAATDPAATDPAAIDPAVDPSSDFVTNTTSDSVTTYSTPSLWWLLLPLIGMPLLLFWLSKRNTGRSVTYVADTDRLEAIVQSNDSFVKVYSAPDATDNVIGTLNDGERVILSGRQNNGWVELAEGGWVSTQHLDLSAEYSVR